MKWINVRTIFVTAVVVLLLAPVAQPQVAAGPAPAPAQAAALSWYVVRGAAFSPNSSTMTWTLDSNSCMGASSAGIWRASLNLPDGAVIKQLVFGYYNLADSTASSAYAFLYYDAGGSGTILSVTSNPGTTHIGFHSVTTTTTLALNTVDNSQYSYMFYWSGSTTQHLCYMRVGYEAPGLFGAALPLVQKGP